MHDPRRREDIEIIGECLPARLAGGRELGQFAQAATLGPEQLEEAEKGVSFADRKQFEDVAGPKRLDPLCEILLGQTGRRQLFRQPPVEESSLGRTDAKCRQLAMQHRQQTDRAFAPGERVAKPGAGSEHRRPGGQHVHVGKVVGRDLQQRRWVGKTVNLVEHDPPATMPPQKRLRVIRIPANARQVAVEVGDVGQRPDERRLAESARAGEPHDPPLTPFLLDATSPQRPIDGAGSLLHVVLSSLHDSV